MTNSVRVTLSNPAPEQQRRFATVVVPTPLCETWGKRAWCLAAEGDQSGMPAALVSQDEHGTEWGIYGSHPPGDVLRYLVPESAMANERPWPLPKYLAHPAVYDDLGELDPECSVLTPQALTLPKRRVNATAGASQVELYTSKGTPAWAWHADVYLRNYSNEPFVKYAIRWIWSDLSSPLTETPCAGVTFRFGERITLDFGPEVGWILHPDGMGATYTPPKGVLAKGQALDVSGWILCTESNVNGVEAPDDPLDYHEQSMREFTADANRLAEYGPVVGLCEDWDGHLGVFGVVPEQPRESEWLSIPGLPETGDFFDVRKGGMPKRTGSTGSQAAFGVMSHANVFHAGFGQAVHQRLRWAQYTSQRWSACTIHHRDAQGHPIAAVDHPNMHEFCQLPFSKAGGTDCLGMPNDQWNPPPWSGEWPACDEMHDQLHPLLCWLALSRDPMARDTTACWVNNRMRHVRTYIQKNLGMDRSVGRNLTNLANAGTIACGAVKGKVVQFCLDHAEVLKQRWDGRNLSGPVKPLQVQKADPRAILYQEYDPQGQPVGEPVPQPFLFPLFESLGGIGIIASWKMTGDPDVLDIGMQVLRTFVEEMIWEYQNGAWEFPWEMLALPDGARLPDSVKNDLGAWQWKDGSEDSYFEQALGGVILLRDLTNDPALKARCERCIAWATDGEPPRRAYGAHHWCTGRRMP